MKAVLLLSLLAAGSAVWIVVAGDDEPKSGLPEGETTPVFDVTAVSGPQEGKTLCYI